MIVWFDSIDSTNAEARRRALAGERGPLWIAARQQTQGRGRRGRAWETAPGNLAATRLCAWTRPPAEAAGVSFVAALAVAELAETYVAPSLVRLKWPNDVLLEGKKLSGILVESGDGWIAVGIGVNLNTSPSNVERPAISLASRAAPPPPELALDDLVGSFERWFGVWGEQGLEPVLDAWRARAAGIPGPCTVRLASGALEGQAEGLDSDGSLLLRLGGGELRRITAGDVFFGSA